MEIHCLPSKSVTEHCSSQSPGTWGSYAQSKLINRGILIINMLDCISRRLKLSHFEFPVLVKIPGSALVLANLGQVLFLVAPLVYHL